MPRRWPTIIGSSSSLLDRVCNATLLVVLVAVLYQAYSFGHDDPHNCRALMSDGVWPPPTTDAAGKSHPNFEKWEPSGCRMTEYSRSDFHDCLAGRRVVFAGDSTVRQIYWAAATRLDHVQAHLSLLRVFAAGQKQQHLSFEGDGVKLEFIWDPWLNSSELATELTRFRAQETLIDSGSVKSQDEESAGLIVIGAPGLWAARHGGDDYLNLFRKGINSIRHHLLSSLDDTMMLPSARLKKNYAAAANQILLAPVQIPWYELLAPGRSETITPERINAMNAYLTTLKPHEKSHIMWTYNKMTEDLWDAFEETGIHVVDGVAERKIDIALNARCNAAGTGHKAPFKRTCCVAYPRERPIQPMLLFLAFLGMPTLLWIHVHTSLTRRILPSSEVLGALRTMLFAVAWCWFTDRTHYFTKVERHYSQSFFLFTCFLGGIASFLSVRTSVQQPEPVADLPTGLSARVKAEEEKDNDRGFLSRDQSNEWKGWMQAIILVYHYNYASQTLWIYKVVRLLVSAYVFLSAYGHTRHLLATGDFSLRRMAFVITRLNALSALLPYMMMSGYADYYFAPVVTFWGYLVVWLTLRVGKRFNQDPLLLLLKVIPAAVAANYFIMSNGPLEGLSTLSRVVFHFSWHGGDMRFRLSLERYVPFFAMMMASLVHRMELIRTRQVLPKSSPLTTARTYEPSHLDPALAVITFPDELNEPLKPMACTCSILFAIFFFAVTQNLIDDKVEYNIAHAYMCWIPIVSYLILRNSTRALRNSYLALPAALGKISLETYVLQYHLWLGADATAMLRIGLWDRYGSPLLGSWSSGPGRLLETALLSVAFLCVSAQTRRATEVLTHWLFGPQQQPRHQRGASSLHHVRTPSGVMLLPSTKERTSMHELERSALDSLDEEDGYGSAPDGSRPAHGRLRRLGRFMARDVRARVLGLTLALWVGNLVYN